MPVHLTIFTGVPNSPMAGSGSEYNLTGKNTSSKRKTKNPDSFEPG